MLLINHVLALARMAVDNKDYAELEYIIECSNSIVGPIYRAIDNLDVEAIKVILNFYNKNKSNNIYGSFLPDGFLISYLMNDDQDVKIKEKLSPDEIADRKKEILKIFLLNMDKQYISLEYVQLSADMLSKKDFEDLVKLQDIDLSSDQFKGLKIPYDLGGLKIALDLDKPAASLVELLLSRSYSDKLDGNTIKSFYEKLYNMHPIAQEMLSLTSYLIAQGNDIKIFFEEGTGSFYNRNHNIIKIDNIHIDQEFCNSESVLIHEMGHFIYSQLFNHDALPFDVSPFKDLTRYVHNKYGEYFYDEFSSLTLFYKIAEDDYIKLNASENFKDLLKKLITYEKAARLPIDKAAEILKLDKEEYSKYIAADDYAEYFKDYSYIDLFYFNSFVSYGQKNITIDTHVIHNIVRIYQSDISNQFCNIPYSSKAELNKEEILNLALEEFLPKIVKEFNITPEEIHFLERIGDYVNRGTHSLSEYVFADKDNEKYIELIVRAMELRAAGLTQDLINSFSELESFHIATSSPIIASILGNNTEISSLPFSVEINGDNVNCYEL